MNSAIPSESDTGSTAFRPVMEGAWQAVGVLFVAWTLAFIDRSIISVLIPGIKATFHASDTRVSLLQGMAFAMFFSVSGLLIGRLVDRANRRNLILIGLLGWSLATIACGLTTSFAALFACRIAVGVSQAVLAPAGFSVVADLFASDRRGRPIAVLMSAGSVGSALSTMVGGVLLSAFTAHAPIVLPLVGARAPWQATLIAAGLPGVLLTLLVATLREPARPGQSGATPAANFDFVGYLRANWLVFSLMLTAFGCHFLLTYGVSSWYPVLLMRGAHLSPASTGLIMGSFQLLGAFIAATCGGWLSDVFAKRDPAGGRLRLVRYALLSQFLILLPLLFPHSLLGLVAAFFFYEPVVIFCSSVVYALLPDFVPATGRGRMLALEQLISSLVGLGLGPTLVATMTDKVFGDESLVNLSMLAVALAAAGLGAAAATLALPAARKLHARLAEGR